MVFIIITWYVQIILLREGFSWRWLVDVDGGGLLERPTSKSLLSVRLRGELLPFISSK